MKQNTFHTATLCLQHKVRIFYAQNTCAGMENIMQRKRNGFLTFCFSCMPGAGQMFLGFLKEGTSLMFIFFSVIFLAHFFQSDAMLIVLPVVWFYSFFDALNKNSLPDEDFYKLQDHYIFVNGLDDFKGFSFSKYRVVAAILIILFGLNLLFNNLVDIMVLLGIAFSYETHQMLFHYIPQVIIALLIIAAGAYLIVGKKHTIEQEITDDESIFSDINSDNNQGGEF